MKIFNFAKLGQTLLMAAVLVVGAVCVSYGDNPSALVGRWVEMPGEGAIELFKDGTGVAYGKNITWKTEGERFVFSGPGGTIVGDYTLTGYVFKLILDKGIATWVRKEHLEEYKKEKAEEAKNKAERIRNELEQKQKQIRKEAEQRIENISSYLTDSRNGQKYRAVKIGSKTWMAQNLNYQTGKSWCYGDDNSNCEKYGRLYDWNTAKTACPAGWHLPSRQEWNDLVAMVGGNVAGKALKSTYGWNSDGNGTDEFGFSALPGGSRFTDGSFRGVGTGGGWWTATEDGRSDAYGRYMYDDEDYVGGGGLNGKGSGFSVRCIKDE